jgi:hypothetical protein
MAVIIFKNDTVFLHLLYLISENKNSFVVGQAVVRVCEPLRPQCQVGASVQHLGSPDDKTRDNYSDPESDLCQCRKD